MHLSALKFFLWKQIILFRSGAAYLLWHKKEKSRLLTLSKKYMKKEMKYYLLLQILLLFMSLGGVVSKTAAGEQFLSFKWSALYALLLFILGVYAVFWQQIIKKTELSIAYINRSIAILWSMLWAFLFFSEKITVKNLIGVVIVIAGTMVVNFDDE